MSSRVPVDPELVIDKLSSRLAELIKSNTVLEVALSEAKDEINRLRADATRRVSISEDPPVATPT